MAGEKFRVVQLDCEVSSLLSSILRGTGDLVGWTPRVSL